jgi:transketolase
VYTHDSIGQGEDGPTHQPVEQLTNLRGTPNLDTWRPCDTLETVFAWRAAVEKRNGPTALVFSRQSLPFMDRDDAQISNIARGAYVLRDTEAPQAILIATGSEVSLAVAAYGALQEQGIATRVVSMPSASVFAAQSPEYQESVLPGGMKNRIAIEAGHPDYWHKWVGLDGRIIGLPTFGESGPGAEVMAHFGFTVENVVDQVKQSL